MASIATLPLSTYHFGTFSLAGLMTNLLAIPLISFIIMPFGTLSFMFSFLGADSTILNFLWNITSFGMDAMMKISDVAASSDSSFFTSGEITIPAMLCILAGVFIIILIRGILRILGIVSIIAGVFVYMNHRLPDAVITKKFFVFRHENRYYAMSKIHNNFVDSTWRGKLGVKYNFDDGHKFCQKNVCQIGKITYIRWMNQEAIEKMNGRCPEILISYYPVDKSKITCHIKTFITQSGLKENTPRLLFL